MLRVLSATQGMTLVCNPWGLVEIRDFGVTWENVASPTSLSWGNKPSSSSLMEKSPRQKPGTPYSPMLQDKK